MDSLLKNYHQPAKACRFCCDWQKCDTGPNFGCDDFQKLEYIKVEGYGYVYDGNEGKLYKAEIHGGTALKGGYIAHRVKDLTHARETAGTLAGFNIGGHTEEFIDLTPAIF
ncbi:MAG: hypothetical protein GY765_15100 [bacterium]|nr:hypothetical protein [bacterium]